MKNKVVIVNTLEIPLAGEICCDDFVENGLVLKLSDKSNIKMWFPLNEIKKIVLPDSTVILGDGLADIFKKLEAFSTKYGLEA